MALFLFILYRFIMGVLGNNRQGPVGGNNRGPGGGGGGDGPPWNPFNRPWGDDDDGQPPPYSKTGTRASQAPWRPGFWTGMAAGGLAGAAGQMLRGGRQNQEVRYRQRGGHRNPDRDRLDRNNGGGGGGGGLGSMRTSTGFGGTNVR